MILFKDWKKMVGKYSFKDMFNTEEHIWYFGILTSKKLLTRYHECFLTSAQLLLQEVQGPG